MSMLEFRIVDRLHSLRNRIKPRKVVTIHHLACSGGTIMTKAIAAMPKAMVLSEIHPDREMHPMYDPLCQVRSGYPDLMNERYKNAFSGHFRREIAMIADITRTEDRQLVIRDHSHVDFAWYRRKVSRLFQELEGNFDVLPIVTVRDPREVWISVKREGWFDGTPEDLCQVQLDLLNAFPAAKVWKYEDFVAGPETTVRAMCAYADIPFVEGFQDRMDAIEHMTGDSGRKGGTIAPRPPKALDEIDAAAFADSRGFAELCNRLGYEKERAA